MMQSCLNGTGVRCGLLYDVDPPDRAAASTLSGVLIRYEAQPDGFDDINAVQALLLMTSRTRSFRSANW